MKNLILILVSLLCTTFLPTRGQTTHGTMVITEGRRYMVAFPQVWTAPTEKPLPMPMMLLLSARDTTIVRISTPALDSDAPRMEKEYTIRPGVVLKVPISTAAMNVMSQTIHGFGISVTADRPFSVGTAQAWHGNGEAAQHLPVEAWGTSYYSMNFYQDRYGFAAKGYQYRPSQILVIADQDSTVVTFRPTVPTEGGKDAPSVAKGASQTVTLMRGETFLIKSLIDTSTSRDFVSDLSGTYITSTKPIGVVSGHTKVATTLLPDVLPPGGFYAGDASMVRNNVHDVMYPTEMAGRTFVTLPTMYTPLRVVGQSSPGSGIGDDRGDVIRLIALEDNTNVRRMSQDGAGFVDVFTLQKGETKIIPSHEEASFWEASAPVLVGQYGKSFAKVVLPKIKAKAGSTDEAQGAPTVEAGMPMLQMVPPAERWITNGTFSSAEAMDAFLNIVFKADEISLIQFDGRPMTSAFGGAVRPLKGTEYAFIRTPVASGTHTITSLSDNVRWMAWNYASLDGLQQGRAYGTAVGIDLSTPCDDDVLADSVENAECDQQRVNVWVSSSGCARGHMIYPLDLVNTTLDIENDFNNGSSTARYSVRVVHDSLPGSATIRTVSSSGKVLDRVLHFEPGNVSSSRITHDFGRQPRFTPVRSTQTLTNPHVDRSVVVTNVSMMHGNNAFDVDAPPTPFVLDPGGSVDVTITCRMGTDTLAKDTLIARTGCIDWKLTEYVGRLLRPTLTIPDVDFGTISTSSTPIADTVEIINRDSVVVSIRDHRSETLSGPRSSFRVLGIDGVPIKPYLTTELQPGQSLKLIVECIPEVVGEFEQLHRFSTDVQGLTLTMRLRANSVDTITSVTGEAETPGLTFTVTPQPINETATLTIATIERGTATIELIDLLGNVISSRTETVTSSPQSFVIGGMNVPSGTYSVRVTANGRQATARIIIAR
ncbi:MAG: T9SS type A sorting domain-containing protein [Ignavibacteria bacterium]|nr:T9SS type A sorting domain-containing protein [Ignavibacteria bacterium]